ncbi:CBU_0592 family membrane protein [Heliomarina baculiformis]|uniref:CBU_0592 family membrane protein n=1 Tax=Heliomarina baculiformis TaxID=2872036 RepID=UPI003B586311
MPLALRCLGNKSWLCCDLIFLAAGSVLVCLSENFNLASTMIHIFWILMSALGLSLSYVKLCSIVRWGYSP